MCKGKAETNRQRTSAVLQLAERSTNERATIKNHLDPLEERHQFIEGKFKFKMTSYLRDSYKEVNLVRRFC